MNRLGSSDFVLGVVMIVLGLAVTGYSAMHYNMGTLRNMGPGMFPAGLGGLLALLGLALFVQGFRSTGYADRLDIRSLAAVVSGVGGFALTIGRFGLVPAIFVLVLLSSLASERLNFARAVGLAFMLSILAYVLFVLLLGLRADPFRWRP